MAVRRPRLKTLALALPLVFLLHVVEEAPGFVAWFNRHAQPEISTQSFLAVNAVALVITLVVVTLLVAAPSVGSGAVAVSWVSLLMLTNGIFHLVATVRFGQYCPGVISGTVLYLPVAWTFIRAVVTELHITPGLAALSALLGSIPMAAHGYLIIFEGSRLF